MDSLTPPLLQRISPEWRNGQTVPGEWIPVESEELFRELAGLVARLPWTNENGDLVLVLDQRTAVETPGFDTLRGQAQQTIIIGAAPPAWRDDPGVTSVCESDGGDGRERLIIVYGSSMCFAMMLAGHDDSTPPYGGHGVWTCQPAAAARALHEVMRSAGLTSAPALEPANSNSGANLDLAMRLMACSTQYFTRKDRDAAVDKNDLYSVLEILKAISARRRSHDILFVFVERIARVVDVDRCSVVRLWAGAKTGHVLASHEDERVYNLVIDIRKYPELEHTLKTGEKVIINDVQSDPLTKDCGDDLASAGIRSLLVAPIVLHDEHVGALLLRCARRTGSFEQREVNFCEIVAEAAANALERAHLFESIQQANQRLERLAVTDGLTGLYNHRFFRQRLDEEFERARRYVLPLCCLIIDIDNFKSINDTYGHLQGDTILRELAKRINGMVRKSDILARYGGEEFMLILPQTSGEGAQIQGVRILEAVSGRPFGGLPAHVTVTVSIGVAVLDHEQMLDSEAMIRVADSALYEAKRRGKNRVIVGNPEAEGD